MWLGGLEPSVNQAFDQHERKNPIKGLGENLDEAPKANSRVEKIYGVTEEKTIR